jgi:FkbM family methyltransferase
MLADPVYALLRRVPVPGVGRLRRLLPIPGEGVREASFPGGTRLRLDLRESIQRDWYAGLYDRKELRALRKLLAAGGDFVDVGAHVGMYTIAAAAALRGRGRVLALEPNPVARAQLEQNLALNGCREVSVVARAAADEAGTALLHVPLTPDTSFSSLESGRFAEGEPLPVERTTVDAEIERLGLAPVLVKIDVEGVELAVLAGMARALGRRPALLIEVGPESAQEVERLLGARGYRGYRFGRRVTPGVAAGQGTFNALFLPHGMEP